MGDLTGEWNCTVGTPVGEQPFTLAITREAPGAFEGKASGAMGALDIQGSVDGDILTWTMVVQKPVSLTATCNARVEGDRLAGKIKAGIFGSYPVTGTRAAAA